MKLSKIEFGNVFNASGARNFRGDDWWFHNFWKPVGLNWTGSTFVSKTTTVEPRAGNMPLLESLQPREYIPKCIKVNLFAGAVLNAVGLSGPGVEKLLQDPGWLNREEPFVISFMAVQPDPQERLRKAKEFVMLFSPVLRSGITAPVAIQINMSCPNVGLDPSGLIDEAKSVLNIMTLLGVPLILKFNALVPVDAAKDIASHPACSAICVSNTIPWGKLPDKIDWKGLFGDKSPLENMGGGGLSGAPLLPIVRDWIERAKSLSFPAPIIAGGGILSQADALSLIEAGASAVELGSVAILRPWRVSGIIQAVNDYFGGK